MGADDQSEPWTDEREGEARSGGDGPGLDAEADMFETLFQYLRGIGDAGVKARGVNSTGGRDGSAMMAGCKSQRPTGGGVQYGTACLFGGARLD